MNHTLFIHISADEHLRGFHRSSTVYTWLVSNSQRFIHLPLPPRIKGMLASAAQAGAHRQTHGWQRLFCRLFLHSSDVFFTMQNLLYMFTYSYLCIWGCTHLIQCASGSQKTGFSSSSVWVPGIDRTPVIKLGTKFLYPIIELSWQPTESY